MQGGPAVVRLLLDAGADPTATDREGKNALEWASPLSQETADLLLAHTPLAPEDASRALLSAAAKGHLTAARRLLEQGAQVQPESEGGPSALQSAVTSRNPDLVDTLLRHPGTRIDYRSHRLLVTPLMTAAQSDKA